MCIRDSQNATFIYSNNFRLARAATNLVSGYTLVIDVFNRTNRYDYKKGLITTNTDPLGQRVIQEWYLPGDTNPGAYQRSIKSRTDRRGLQTSYLYDSSGNVTQTTVTGDLSGDGLGHQQSVSAFTYNTNNLLTPAIDPAGRRR